MLKGLDISSFQGQPDYSLLKTDFLIVKATEGVGFTDPSLVYNTSHAHSFNIPLGYYHFARPDLGNTAQAEADFFLSVVTPQDGEILFLDYEVNYANPVEWSKEFLDTISAKLNYKPLIYLNLSLIQNHDWSPVVNAGYGIWLADYDRVSDNAPNTPWPVVAFKQWTSTGSVEGINVNVDLDTFFGDLTALKAYGYHQPTMQPPAQPILTDDELRSLSVLKTHFSASTTLDGQPFGNLEGYANTLTQDAYTAWKNSSLLSSQLAKAQLDLTNSQSETINAKNALSNLQTEYNTLSSQLKDCQSSVGFTPTSFWGKTFLSWAKSAG